MNEIVTADLSRFGHREIDMASELLQALTTPSRCTIADGMDVNGLTINMNMNSGYVFLCDEDYNTYMMNGDQLEPFLSSPYEGLEGFYDELKEQYGDMCHEDKEWLIDHAKNYNLHMTHEMIADDEGVRS